MYAEWVQRILDEAKLKFFKRATKRISRMRMILMMMGIN